MGLSLNNKKTSRHSSSNSSNKGGILSSTGIFNKDQIW